MFCSGPCHKAYHLKCLVRVRGEEVAPDSFKCDECVEQKVHNLPPFPSLVCIENSVACMHIVLEEKCRFRSQAMST